MLKSRLAQKVPTSNFNFWWKTKNRFVTRGRGASNELFFYFWYVSKPTRANCKKCQPRSFNFLLGNTKDLFMTKALWFKTAWFWDIKIPTFPRACEWAKWARKRSEQQSMQAKQARRSKRMSERCKRMSERCEWISERISEWPSTCVPILGWSEPQFKGRVLATLLATFFVTTL